MKKIIFITCITRMDETFACVAGIDEHNRFVRPTIDYPDERPGIKQEFLFSPLGEELVRPLTYVEFEFIEHRPEIPYHSEDWIIDRNVPPRIVSRSNDDASRRILERNISSSLSVAISKRDRSLVTIKTPFAPKIKVKIDEEKRLSCRFVMKDSAGDWITNARTATAPPRITDASGRAEFPSGEELRLLPLDSRAEGWRGFGVVGSSGNSLGIGGSAGRRGARRFAICFGNKK